MSELASFHQFLGSKLDQFGECVSPEEVLDLWRAIHPPNQELRQEVKALEEAIKDMNAGDCGIDLAEFDVQFRLQNQIL